MVVRASSGSGGGGGTLNPSVPQAAAMYGQGGSASFTIDLSKRYILNVTTANGTTIIGGTYYIESGSSTLVYDAGASTYLTISISGTSLTISCGSWVARYFPVTLIQLD